MGWIGVDLDGTLAEYHGWHADGGIGAPIPKMVARVRQWLAEGTEVRIVTARACAWDSTGEVPRLDHEQVSRVSSWCLEHIGIALRVQFWKDYEMLEIWDDRAVQVRKNTGEPILDPTSSTGPTE